MARTPFFGRGPAPQIARMDMQAATAPGRNWGKAFESIGQTVGDTLEKFRADKEKKKQQTILGDTVFNQFKDNPEAIGAADEEELRAITNSLGKNPDALNFVTQFQRDAQTAEMNEQLMTQREMLIKSLGDKKDLEAGLARFMVGPPKPKAIPSGVTNLDGRQIPTLPGKFASNPYPWQIAGSALGRHLPQTLYPQRRVPEQGFKPTGPSINVVTGEVTAPTPPIAQPLPERFQALLNSDLSPEAKAQGLAEIKAEAMAQQKLAAEQGSAALDKQIKVNEELRNQTGFAQEQGVMSFDGLTIGTGENASILQGKIGDKAEAKKAKEGLNNLNSILRDLDQLIALGYKRENSRMLSDDDKEKAAQLANRVRGQIREEILGPGTVTGPEFDRLAAQVPDPTAGFDLFSAQFGEEGSRLLEQVKADLIKKIKGKYAAYGVTAGGTANPANTRQLSTGKEVEIIFDPAE